MKVIFNIFAFIIGMILIGLWLQVTVFILTLLVLALFLLSLFSLFIKESGEIAKDIISLTKSWMNIPVQILDTFEYN